jgi:hypothetical protein
MCDLFLLYLYRSLLGLLRFPYSLLIYLSWIVFLGLRINGSASSRVSFRLLRNVILSPPPLACVSQLYLVLSSYSSCISLLDLR